MVYAWEIRISRKEVCPEIPANVVAQAGLQQDLVRMGYTGLYHVTWDINNVGIIKEAFIGSTPPEFNDNPLQEKSEF